MPKIKYSDNKMAEKYSNGRKYWEVVTKAVKEMHKQVKNLKINKRGITK